MANTTNIGPDLLDAAAALHDESVELRRAIHAEPEIGPELPETQAKILDAISGLGLDVTVGESTPSVVADLDTGRDDLDPSSAAPNHSNLMRVNESALSDGVALYAAMALVA